MASIVVVVVVATSKLTSRPLLDSRLGRGIAVEA